MGWRGRLLGHFCAAQLCCHNGHDESAMATPFTQCARGQSQCNHTGHAFHSSGCTWFLQGEEADDDEEEDEGRKNVTDKYVGVNVSDSADG
jgi:hypothetical protein